MQGEEVTETHKHLRIEKGKLLYPPQQRPYPPLYFGGSSDAGGVVAAKHVDVYLTWGEPPHEVAKKIARAKELAAREGRTFSYGIRLHVIVRETSAEAWRAADELISKLDDQTIETAQRTFAPFRFRRSASHGAPAWRAARQARSLAKLVGGRWACARRRRDRARRQS
jgi:alkanesulfonate monooxygenase